MKSIEINIDGKKAMGLVVKLNKAPLVLATGRMGFVMCGYLNVDAAEKMGEAAAVVRGVSSIEDLLGAKIVALTTAATQLGVKEGMTGKEALSCLL